MPSPAGFDRRLLKQVVLIVFRRTDLQIRTNHIRCLQTFQKGITFEVIILNILKKSINISSIKYEYEIIISDSGANTLDSGASVAHSSLLITRSPQCTVRGCCVPTATRSHPRVSVDNNRASAAAAL